MVVNTTYQFDYYPFGMIMPGRSFTSESYRYGFNGMEKDSEIKGKGNQYDFGMRIYDPRFGRFLSIDPLSAQGPWWTPYSFAANSPIIMVDEDGKFPLLAWLAKGALGGAIDAGMQFSINLALNGGNAEAAYEAIDWGQALISAGQSMLPWSPPGGKWGRAAFTAASDIAINYARGKYDGLEGDDLQMKIVTDFLVGYASSVGVESLGEGVQKFLKKVKSEKMKPGVTPPNKTNIEVNTNKSSQTVHTKTETKIEEVVPQKTNSSSTASPQETNFFEGDKVISQSSKQTSILHTKIGLNQGWESIKKAYPGGQLIQGQDGLQFYKIGDKTWTYRSGSNLKTEALDDGITIVGTIEFNDKSGIAKKVKARFINY